MGPQRGGRATAPRRAVLHPRGRAGKEQRASIGRWLEQHGELPDWVDRDRLERGCTVLIEHGPQVCVALATASLVYCYAGYPGVKVLTRTIARRNHRSSDEGILMTRALFALHSGSLPAGFEGAAPALTRYLLGDDVCALVGLPRSRWDRAITWQAGVGRVLDRAQASRGAVGSLTKMVGAGILTQRVVGLAGWHSASFSIPVPPELERRWTASGVFPRIDPELIEIAQAERA